MRRESDSNDLLSSFLFSSFLFAHLFRSPLVSSRYLLPLLRVVLSVKQLLSSPCCFVRATCVCSYSALCCSSCSLSFPVFLHHILQNTYLSFVLLCFLFCFLVFSLFLFFVVWSALFCCRRYKFGVRVRVRGNSIHGEKHHNVGHPLLCSRTQYAGILLALP